MIIKNIELINDIANLAESILELNKFRAKSFQHKNEEVDEGQNQNPISLDKQQFDHLYRQISCITSVNKDTFKAIVKI